MEGQARQRAFSLEVARKIDGEPPASIRAPSWSLTTLTLVEVSSCMVKEVRETGVACWELMMKVEEGGGPIGDGP